MGIRLDLRYSGISQNDIDALSDGVNEAHARLRDKTGEGSEFLGWLTLPFDLSASELMAIKSAAAEIRRDSDILVVVGIGGSYLGARAVIEALGSQYFNETAKTKIIFAGNSISGAELSRVISLCKNKRFSINVISKSGTTTEPAVAFRVLKKLLEKQVGEAEAAKRIYATTDKARGTLKSAADRNGYRTFVIPDDVGGRYSVLTAVGLLPVAVAGFDIDSLLEGAAAAARDYSVCDLKSNDCYRYAAARNILYRRQKTIEILVSYEPAFSYMNEWWKQLYGESEGKQGKGLFPASVSFSTDLHSMGQCIQDGVRNLFETVVWFKEPNEDITVEREPDDFDSLNFLSGRRMSYINHRAYLGTLAAHVDGGVPNIVINLPRLDEFSLGELIFFFEKACAVSGMLLGVNPFDQPGVEAYKKNMFALLNKPGYEEHGAFLAKKLNIEGENR